MIVVDTNVIAYFWIQSEFSDLADKLFEKVNYWVSPYLWRSEFRNVLSVYFRNNFLSAEEAIQTAKKAEDFMKNREYPVSNDKVFNFVTKSTLTAYDCEFVSLANDLSIPLITSDKKILSSFPDIAIPIHTFVT